MTHTLHREGALDSLENDYVVLAIAAQGVNAKGKAKVFKDFLEIIKDYNPVNIGDMKTGNIFSKDLETIENSFQDNSIVHGVFTDKDTVIKVMKKLKEADLGLSIVVTGLFDETFDCCNKADVKPHTTNHSLGIWGKTEKLPKDEVLDITTMCGHGMVSMNLISKMIDDVKNDKTTAQKASEKLAEQCHCGIFNPKRAEEIITSML